MDLSMDHLRTLATAAAGQQGTGEAASTGGGAAAGESPPAGDSQTAQQPGASGSEGPRPTPKAADEGETAKGREEEGGVNANGKRSSSSVAAEDVGGDGASRAGEQESSSGTADGEEASVASPSKRARKSDPDPVPDGSSPVPGEEGDDLSREVSDGSESRKTGDGSSDSNASTSGEDNTVSQAEVPVMAEQASAPVPAPSLPPSRVSEPQLPPPPPPLLPAGPRNPASILGPQGSLLHTLMPKLPTTTLRPVLPKGRQAKLPIPANPAVLPLVPPLSPFQHIHARQAHLLSPVPATSPTGSPVPTSTTIEQSGNGKSTRGRKRRQAVQGPASTSPLTKKTRRSSASQASKNGAKKEESEQPSTQNVLDNVRGSSSSSSQAAATGIPLPPLSDDVRLLLSHITITLPEQVVYWGQSKTKCDVTARVSVPARLQSHLNNRTFCYSRLPSEKTAAKMADHIGEGEEEPLTQTSKDIYPTNEEEQKTAMLVLKRQSDSECDYEAIFKQCIDNKRLSNLTLLELVFTLIVDGHPITKIVPLVTYTHSKAITRACCRLLWHPTSEKDVVSISDLVARLDMYYKNHLGCSLHPSEKNYFQSRLSNQKNVIGYEEFYSVLGEWFVLAVKLAKKKKQYLWQQGDKSFIPLLINPTREDPSILKEPGDFVVYIGEDMKPRKGSNSLPALMYPLQITYISPDGLLDSMGVENKLDKLTGFIHEKQCLRHYVVLGRDGEWTSIEKEKFAFNAAQHRRWETTGGETCVVGRAEGQCASYAHSN